MLSLGLTGWESKKINNVNDNEITRKEETKILNAKSELKDGTLYCSPEFFSNIKGVTVNASSDKVTLTGTNAKVEVTLDGACTVNGEAVELYGTPFKGEKAIMIPAAHLATLLGFEVVADEKLVIVGTGIGEFAKNKNLRKIAAYLTCLKEVDVAKLRYFSRNRRLSASNVLIGQVDVVHKSKIQN